jgi:hypothetical protein
MCILFNLLSSFPSLLLHLSYFEYFGSTSGAGTGNGGPSVLQLDLLCTFYFPRLFALYAVSLNHFIVLSSVGSRNLRI